ncbi:MAG: hypothetical protein V4772_17620 [Pseudomonadota bacterium]
MKKPPAAATFSDLSLLTTIYSPQKRLKEEKLREHSQEIATIGA